MSETNVAPVIDYQTVKIGWSILGLAFLGFILIGLAIAQLPFAAAVNPVDDSIFSIIGVAWLFAIGGLFLFVACLTATVRIMATLSENFRRIIAAYSGQEN